MSPSTARFLLWLLKQINLRAGDPHFEQITAAIVKARVELEQIATDPPAP